MNDLSVRSRRCGAWFLVLWTVIQAGWFGGLSHAETDPKFYAVEASAEVQLVPAQIILSWPADPRASSYVISRKAPAANSWNDLLTLPGNATRFVDSDVSVGTVYEYQIRKTTTAGYAGFGYLYAGIQAPLVESRGKVILVVENTHAADLAPELERLHQDLVGDGWTVIRKDVSRNDTPPKVKELIRAEYLADPSRVNTVFLFGRVPVPYSGNFNPDGHPDHQGAWAADVYYGDMDGTWTDTSVNNTRAERAWNRNVPGDGKFDQSELPSDVELAVGRVDLANMTCFANKTPSRSERDLLRQYLNKDHRFRHGMMNIERRGLICDNFGEREGEAFASSGWRNFAPFFGAQNVTAIPGWTFFPTLSSQGYLWSYGTGGGSWYTCNGIGSSDDFAKNDIKSVFTMFLGSYFGDWDNESNFLRAPLGSSSYTLTSAWAGRPHWFLHPMGLGETIGFVTRLSQNNGNGGLYSPRNYGTRGVHVALMGDPTLRMHPVIPPSSLSGALTENGVSLSWGPSADSDLQGYHLFRGSSPHGPFTRLTTAPVNGLAFTDTTGAAGHTYMVRAIKLERSGSGTYLNPSQGVFFTAGSTSGGNANSERPSAPALLTAGLSASGGANLSWSDTSSNESGFKVERGVDSGSFVQIATVDAGETRYTDTGLAGSTAYSYRVRAFNSAGNSLYSNEASLIAAAPVHAAPATASFVGIDTATRGNWKGVYGGAGFQLVGDLAKYPAYIQPTIPNGKFDWSWVWSTSDPRGLQRAASSERIASCWNAPDSFTMDLNFSDGAAHRVAVYCMDWDSLGRTQTLEILDPATGRVLDTRTLSSFSGGHYVIWELTGRVQLRLTRVSGPNTVMSGIFFDAAKSQVEGAGGVIKTTAAEGNALDLRGGDFHLRVTGKVGEEFEIQSSADLSTWQPIKRITLSSVNFDFTDHQAVPATTRFYRAVPVR